MHNDDDDDDYDAPIAWRGTPGSTFGGVRGGGTPRVGESGGSEAPPAWG